MEEEKQCILVRRGHGQGTADRHRRRVSRKSVQVLLDKRRGLEMGLALGDGALGFWKASGLPRRPRATLLGSQDGQRLEQAAQGPPRGACKTSDRNQEGCESAFDFFLEAYGPKYARGLPGQGPRRPADVLRLPRRALEACAKPHREHVRHGSSAHLPDRAACRARRRWPLQTMRALRENGENSMDRTISRDRGVIVDGERQDHAAA